MEVNNILTTAMFGFTCLFLVGGFPVALSLAGSGLIFAAIANFLGVFDFSIFGALPSRIYGNSMTNELLIAVPLFVFMGVMLERSRVAEDLLDSMGMMFGRVRGGLGVSVTIVGALLAASTGIVGATVVTMGLLSLPTMLKRGYSPSLACGSICASGTLGQIIPPSIVLVLLGDQISNAYTSAQRELGNWSPEPVSVGDLFAGAFFPGLSLVAMYIIYQLLIARLKPESSPIISGDDINMDNPGLHIFKALVPPVALIVSVLGSILAGIATPTEAASVGALGATFLAAMRMCRGRQRPVPVYAAVLGLLLMVVLANTFDLRVTRDVIPAGDMIAIVIALLSSLGLAWGSIASLIVVYREKTEKGISVLHDVMRSTMSISSMVFVILIGSSVFSLVFRGLGGDEMVNGLLGNLPGGSVGAMIVVMAVMFVLGFFLDFIEITFVVVPIVAPALLLMGLNPVWLGVMMAMNLQTSFLTPPFGFALFYLRGVAPREVTTMHIYRGVVPFIVIQVIGIGLLAYFPQIATWLPKVIFG